MAKNITFFDKEHTSGINLAAMEDTQLKENLVQDVAAGGNEAPTATAVKEAVDAKMDKADIVNDLTTGGVDKALSAEQGKVLEGKKVDKLTDATDLVYVHGSDGTEQGKALAEFVVDTDIVNDVTTGGTDKVLSAEQGKVLEEKKVDKVTTPDSVYVTEGSKPLSEFVVDADIVNDRVTGGTDKVLAAEVGKDVMATFELNFTAANYPLTAATIDKTRYTDHVMSISTLYIHPDEIPADIKGKLKKGDLVSTVVVSPIISCKAIFSNVATADETSTNVTSDIVNTSLPAAGNWEGWYAFNVIVSEQDKLMVEGKSNVYIAYLHDGDETLETLPDGNGPMPTGGFSYSVVFIKPSDIKANKESSVPTPYIKQVDGSTIKPGDFLIIRTSLSAASTKKIKDIYCIISHTAPSTLKQLNNATMNTSLPASGNWGGWLVGCILSSGWDRAALLSKTDSTKMQNYMVTLPEEGKTFASMPDLIGFNSDKGVMQSNFFVHPDDITSISASMKKGDTVLFLGKNSPTGKAIGPVTAIYAGYINDGAIPNDDITLNVTDPDGGNFAGWHAFTCVGSAYGRVQIGNKLSLYHSTTTISSADTPETAATLTGCDVTAASNKAVSYMFVKPEELGITDYKKGDSVLVDISAALAKESVTIEGWLGAKVTDGTATFDGLALNTKLPTSGNWNGFCRLYITSINTNAAVINTKARCFVMTSTDDNSNLPYGLQSMRPITFANGTDTDSFYDSIKPGDLIKVYRNGTTAYLLQFNAFASGAVDATLVGFDQAPADMTGFLRCSVIASLYNIGYRNILTTTRYAATQFEVGKKYKISVKPVGTDTLRVGGIDIKEASANLYKVPTGHNFIPGSLLRLMVSGQLVLGYIEDTSITTDWKLSFICINKSTTDVIDLTTGA